MSQIELRGAGERPVIPPSISHASMWRMFDSEDEEDTSWWGAPAAAIQGLRGALAMQPPPDLMLQAIVALGEQVTEGRLIQFVTPAWYQIVDLMLTNPQAMHELDWRAWEELIAASYAQLGFDVVLTPRTGDKGRDVIATLGGVGSIRIIDQVKKYSPGNLVLANDVRALIGVLSMDKKASKGVITTTSTFAPGVFTDPDIQGMTPTRLELRSGENLFAWLKEARAKRIS
jgi:restriction system protein